MKHILCVHQGHELYGSDRVFLQSVQAFRQEWPDAVITAHLPQDGPLTRHLQPMVDHIVFGNLSVIRRGHFEWRSIGRFIRNIGGHYKHISSSDMIYINSLVTVSYVFWAILCRKKHFILHVHEIATGSARLYSCLVSFLANAVILANSKATRKALCRSSRVRVVYNGVKPVKEYPVRPQTKTLSLLLMGRLNEWKGQSLAVEAMQLLNMPHIHLHIVGSYYGGNAHYRTNLENRIKDSGLADRITLHDFSEQPGLFYQSHDVLLVPSTRPEPFGLVAVEAMNHGMPVIAANHGGLSEIVEDGKTGLLVVPGSVESLANAIRFYDEHREYIADHGKVGRQRFLALFQEETYMRRLLQAVTE